MNRPKETNICPKFASCITPCAHGRRDYFFVKDVCLTRKHKTCTHSMSEIEDQVITPEAARAVGESIKRCSRLRICTGQSPYYGTKRSPIPEYEERICKTQEHLKCLYYITWWFSGRWPDDNMDSLEIKDGPSYKEAVLDRLKGEQDGFIPFTQASWRGAKHS